MSWLIAILDLVKHWKIGEFAISSKNFKNVSKMASISVLINDSKQTIKNMTLTKTKKHDNVQSNIHLAT
jgi:hypothetical protein